MKGEGWKKCASGLNFFASTMFFSFKLGIISSEYIKVWKIKVSISYVLVLTAIQNLAFHCFLLCLISSYINILFINSIAMALFSFSHIIMKHNNYYSTPLHWKTGCTQTNVTSWRLICTCIIGGMFPAPHSSNFNKTLNGKWCINITCIWLKESRWRKCH